MKLIQQFQQLIRILLLGATFFGIVGVGMSRINISAFGDKDAGIKITYREGASGNNANKCSNSNEGFFDLNDKLKSTKQINDTLASESNCVVVKFPSANRPLAKITGCSTISKNGFGGAAGGGFDLWCTGEAIDIKDGKTKYPNSHVIVYPDSTCDEYTATSGIRDGQGFQCKKLLGDLKVTDDTCYAYPGTSEQLISSGQRFAICDNLKDTNSSVGADGKVLAVKTISLKTDDGKTECNVKLGKNDKYYGGYRVASWKCGDPPVKDSDPTNVCAAFDTRLQGDQLGGTIVNIRTTNILVCPADKIRFSGVEESKIWNVGNFYKMKVDGKWAEFDQSTLDKICGEPVKADTSRVFLCPKVKQADFIKNYQTEAKTNKTGAFLSDGTGKDVNESIKGTNKTEGDPLTNGINNIFSFLLKIVLAVVLILLIAIEMIQGMVFLIMSTIISTLMDLSPTSSILANVAKPLWGVFVGIANFILVSAVVWTGVQVMVGLKKVSEITNTLLYLAVYALIENTTFQLISFVVYIMDSFAKLLVFIFAGGDLNSLFIGMAGLFGSISRFRNSGSVNPDVDKFLKGAGDVFQGDTSYVLFQVVTEAVIVMAMLAMIVIFYRVFIVVISRVVILILLMITSPIWVLLLLLNEGSPGLVPANINGMLTQIRETLIGLIIFNVGFVVIMIISFLIGQKSYAELNVLQATNPLIASNGGVVASADAISGLVSGKVSDIALIAQWITIAFLPSMLTLATMWILTDALREGAIPKILGEMANKAATAVGQAGMSLGTGDFKSLAKQGSNFAQASIGLKDFSGKDTVAGGLIKGAGVGTLRGLPSVAYGATGGLIGAGIGGAGNVAEFFGKDGKGLKDNGNYIANPLFTAGKLTSRALSKSKIVPGPSKSLLNTLGNSKTPTEFSDKIKAIPDDIKASKLDAINNRQEQISEKLEENVNERVSDYLKKQAQIVQANIQKRDDQFNSGSITAEEKSNFDLYKGADAVYKRARADKDQVAQSEIKKTKGYGEEIKSQKVANGNVEDFTVNLLRIKIQEENLSLAQNQFNEVKKPEDKQKWLISKINASNSIRDLKNNKDQRRAEGRESWGGYYSGSGTKTSRKYPEPPKQVT